MNRDDAREDLNNGHAIRFRTWWWGKFVRLNQKVLVDENGKPSNHEEIFKDFDGWERYRENQHGKKK